MSLPDGAEYWWGNTKHVQKHVFTHKTGLKCGHFHVTESDSMRHIDCYACIKIMSEAGIKSYSCKVCKDAENVLRGEDYPPTTEYTCNGCKRRIIATTEDRQKMLVASAQSGSKCGCGGHMTKRLNNKDGSYFLGCSNYPTCKNTVTI